MSSLETAISVTQLHGVHPFVTDDNYNANISGIEGPEGDATQTTIIHSSVNNVIPIYRLPDDLLEDIFLLIHVPEEENNGWIVDYPNRQKDLIKLAGVSSRWLNIVLNSPRLWAYLRNSDSLEKTKLSLSRSKECPLVINWVSNKKSNEDLTFSELINPHLSRLRVFQASFGYLSYPNLKPVIAEVASQPAPFLERFLVRFNCVLHSSPAGLFTEFAPSLRHLHLGSLLVPWNSKVITNLTSLELTVGHEITLEQYGILLKSSPKLKWLCLISEASRLGYSFPFETSPTSTSPISLPHLQFLRLAYLPAVVTWFLLSSIAPAPEQAIQISAYRVQEVEAIVPPPSSKWCLLSRIQSSTWLCMSGEERDGLARVHCGVGAVHPPQPPNYTLELHGFPLARLSLWKVLLPSYGNTFITSISVSCIASGVQELFGQLKLCTCLENLMLYDIQRDGSAVPAFTALQKIETPGYSWWPCPNLKQLLVQGLTSHRSLLELTEARYAFRWASVATAPEPLERLVIRSGQNFQFDYWVRDAEVINRLQAILAQKGGRLIMQHESRHYDGTRKVHEVSWPLEKDIN